MAPDDADPKDPKVADLLAGAQLSEVVDDAARKELERWFGLPSFTELAEKPPERPRAEDDPEIRAVREKRAAAIAAVDPRLVDSLRERTEASQADLLRFTPNLETHVDPDLALFQPKLADRAMLVAEPRVFERPEYIEDNLKERVPQALLRDLHRPVTYFDKLFEIVDVAAEQKLDIVAEVDAAMRTSWKLPELGGSPFREANAAVSHIRDVRRERWATLWLEKRLPNRTVTG